MTTDVRRDEPAAAPDLTLPSGVALLPITPHDDSRGRVQEIFRNEWIASPAPVQWNAVRSVPRTLRGVHVHHTHWDYLTVAAGALHIGLFDLRVPDGQPQIVTLDAERPELIVIPPGVAHGFCAVDAAMHVYGVSDYWNPADELGCHYADPELGFHWPVDDPLVSERDAVLGTLAALRVELGRFLADIPS